MEHLVSFSVLLSLLFLLSSQLAHSHRGRAADPSPGKQPTQQRSWRFEAVHPGLSAAAGLAGSKRYEGSSDLVHLRYHMGPVLSSPMNIYLIWYGRWDPAHQATIRDFLLSISDDGAPPPSVRQWWSTVALYTDQTGANITRDVSIPREVRVDPHLSRGAALTRLSVQQVIADAVAAQNLPVDPRNGVYLVLTAPEVAVQDFCRAVCGFHYFTFPSIVGHTLPYAWVGNSVSQCPDVCAYPFAVPRYMVGKAAMAPPNADAGVDGMVSVIGHELAELSSNPLVNAWYAGEDPTAPTEIADLCEGVYGTGGGGGYTGQVRSDGAGRTYNLYYGRKGRSARGSSLTNYTHQLSLTLTISP